MRTFVVTLSCGIVLSALAAATAAGAPARAAKLTPAEQKWATPLVGAYNLMAANLGVFVDEEKAANALLAGSGKNNTLLTRSLVAFASCPGTVKTAGKAPTARLAGFAATMTSACAHLATGAQDIAKASGAYRKNNGKLVTSYLTTGNAELKKGSDLLARAAKQLTTLGGKNIFEA